MASRRVGITLIPCQLFSCSLVGMKYYTKAGEGRGESWYRHLDALPIYGMGQGSCALPVVWTLISVVLINTLCELHKGMTFTTPDGKINTKRPIKGLINDTTIGTNTARNNSSCLSKVQELTKSWEHFLFLSGGMLTRDKYFYYHIDWEWNEGRHKWLIPRDPTLTFHAKTRNQTDQSQGNWRRNHIGPSK